MTGRNPRWGELPPVPPVMVQGTSVTYTGQAAADARSLLALGLSALRFQAKRTGVSVPSRYELVLHAAEIAAENLAAASTDMRTSTDVRESSTPAVSTSGQVVGVDEAVRLFGVGSRQARRIVEQAGGTKTSKGWRIDSGLLQAEFELRRTA